MADRLTLIGFEHSVYTRIVRMALIELGLEANYVEANPFTNDPVLDEYTPLGRVPVLRHGDFTLTETAAILRYLVHWGRRCADADRTAGVSEIGRASCRERV